MSSIRNHIGMSVLDIELTFALKLSISCPSSVSLFVVSTPKARPFVSSEPLSQGEFIASAAYLRSPYKKKMIFKRK
jgi:hypothetical protein